MSGGAVAMGVRLQELRQGKGFSQSQLAREAGIPLGSLKNWEQGLRIPRLDTAFRLARALGISLDALAGNVFEEKAKGKGRARKRKKADPGGE